MKTRIIFPVWVTLLMGFLLAACASTSAQSYAPGKPPIAVYVSQAGQGSTKVWDAAQLSCEGKPLYQWRSAGTFTWHFSYSGFEILSTIAGGEPEYTLPEGENCGWLTVGLGDLMKDVPAEGTKSKWQGSCQTSTVNDTKTIAQEITSMVVGWEEKTTRLGTFHALRVKSVNQYVDGKSVGVQDVDDWYVCGYGRIYSASSDTGRDVHYVDELLSFTPQSTDEAHVRFILADIQLANTPATYQASTTDEETAEALRRWNGGVRVANVDQLARKQVEGQWQIVYNGSDRPVNPIDIQLTTDQAP